MLKDCDLEGSDMSILNKLTKEEWNSIERPVDGVTKQVLNKLLYYNKNDDKYDSDSKLKTSGEEMYLTVIRPQLVKVGYLGPIQKKEPVSISDLKGKKEKKPKKQVIKKEDQIKIMNLSATITREIVEVFKTFNTDKLTFEYGLRRDLIEFRIATIIYMCHWYLTKKGKPDDKLTEDIYKLIQTIRGVVSKIQTKKFRSKLDSLVSLELSPIIIDDLLGKCSELEKHIKFDIYNIFSLYPWLTDISNYYKVIPEFDVNLYKCQKELLELTNSNDSYLCMYRSNFGSGKTTSTIGVVANQIHTTSFVIYCCASDAVRHTVSQLAYNAGIKFAIANIWRDTVRITNNNLCKGEKERKLIVSDYITTYILLKYKEKFLSNFTDDDIILIIDEPTDGADEDKNVKTKYFSRIFYHAPKRTLLVSATLPSQEKLQPYINHFKSKYNDTKIVTIISKDVKVGCEIILRDGTSYSPHNDCETKEDLQCVIHKLNTDQFVSRLYTANILISLYNNMKSANIPNLPNLISVFMKTENLNHNTIKQIIINLLQLLSEQPIDIIKEICQCKSTYNRQDIYGDCKVDKRFDYSKLGTSDAHKFMGPTLLIDVDPFQMADTAFGDLLKNDNATQIIEDYKRNKNSEKKNVERMEREMEKMNASKLKEDRMSKETRQHEMNEIIESLNTELMFQQWKQINTYHHLNKYATTVVPNITKKYIRRTMDLSLIPFETSVTDSIMIKRFAGVGIYVPQSSHVDNLYTNDVIENTLMGTLAFTLSDTSISYGVNSPADNIIICDTAVCDKSIGTILQLLARVGRPGLSWTAFAFIDNGLKNTLHNYIFDKKVYNPEAEHMNLALDRYKDELVHAEQEAVVREARQLNLAYQQKIKDFRLAQIAEQQALMSEETLTRTRLEEIENKLHTFTIEQFARDMPKLRRNISPIKTRDVGKHTTHPIQKYDQSQHSNITEKTDVEVVENWRSARPQQAIKSRNCFPRRNTTEDQSKDQQTGDQQAEDQQVDRRQVDRRQGDRRQGDRRQGDQQTRDSGQETRRQGDRRTGDRVKEDISGFTETWR